MVVRMATGCAATKTKTPQHNILHQGTRGGCGQGAGWQWVGCVGGGKNGKGKPAASGEAFGTPGLAWLVGPVAARGAGVSCGWW